MLKLIDYRTTAKGLPDLTMYAALIAPGIILNKDGSFLAAWEISGQDTASSTGDELAWISRQVNQALLHLDTGWMLHVDAVRSPHHAYPANDTGFFPDQITRIIDNERRKFFGSGFCYKTKVIMSLTYKPSLRNISLSSKIHTGDMENSSMEKALQQYQNTLTAIEDLLSSVLKMNRLTEEKIIGVDGTVRYQSQLLAYLQNCLTGEEYPAIRVPDNPMYLDALLGGIDITGGLSPRIGEQYLSVISIDGLPAESWPSMFSVLDTIPISYRYSTRFICLSQLDSLKEINSYRKGWQQQMFRFIDMLTNNQNARINRDAQMMRDDTEEALLEVQSGMVGIGYLSSCIILLDENKEEIQEQTRIIRRVLQGLGFGCRAESINALEAWLGSHPGNGYANIRRPLINTLNLAHMLPLSTVWTGDQYNPCPFYPPQSRPLTVLTTDGATPFWFNLHSNDIGHTLIFGPTGSGKSTLLGLITAQFRGYRDAQIVAFDKGQSLYPLCLASGGHHYNIGDNELAFAPLQHIDESDIEFTWAANWIAALAELQKLTILPMHRNAIHAALTTLRHNPPAMRSLTDFWHIVQDQELKEALTHYTRQGAMGHLLDAVEDQLNIASFMVFEIESLMEMGEANLIPVLLYLFHRFEKSLTGHPSLLILDEAWVMLGHSVFRAKIREWLKVLRKSNCAVVLATQSLSDAKKSGIMDVLIESCPTKILLPNHAAKQDNQYSLYVDIGLNQRQIDIVTNATPKQDYYIISPEGRRLVQLALGPITLSFIGASDRDSLYRIKNLSDKHGSDWPDIWLNERRVI